MWPKHLLFFELKCLFYLAYISYEFRHFVFLGTTNNFLSKACGNNCLLLQLFIRDNIDLINRKLICPSALKQKTGEKDTTWTIGQLAEAAILFNMTFVGLNAAIIIDISQLFSSQKPHIIF